ncbi:hypothetical protein B0H67DRAFT_494801 [Lasiosphaeris hirsuta]|uniref:BZIP domain-containing protein n=1 Tax=Lasiosphaeris hirsuta TaxID=260670 RepID=A0AA40DNI7_9PEZI|nr:hypothetical protein B0H67DRAFT_494801 [Lasiosphaeris hirsuta]
MRYSQGDLAILSAEIYTPGLPYSAPGRPAVTKKTPPTRSSEEGPRKRAKRQSPEEAVEPEEEEKKRTRGRPRLDAKDETAADRRRTQIRLAQRAYRNRKETAIQTLERKVQDLKDINEEMSNTFMQLHDSAMNAGVLDRNPEFSRHLRLTTEKFLSLARQASEDGAKDDDAGNGSVHNSSDDRAEQAKSNSPEIVGRVPTTVAEKPKGQTILYGGLMVSHEPMNEYDLLHDFASDYVPPTSSALDFEVITQPTLENASFPFGSAPEFDFLSFSNPSPYSPLPLPRTYTSREATFGRRLHRFATERALFLISMPYPNPDRFNEVFGFCLLIETREAIHERLRRTVGRSIQENLSNWQYPFYNLGGAGTHFDADDMAVRRGSEDGIDVLKPNNTAGFSTGPFTPDIVGVQESSLGKGMRMDLAGFRGDYFDCDEVELYLHHRGIIIPAGADHITAEIDPAKLGNGPAARPSYSATTGSGFAALTAPTGTLPEHNPFAPQNSRGNGSSTSSLSPAPSTEVAMTAVQQPSSAAWSFSAGQASLIDPLLAGVFSGTSHGSYMAMAAATTSGGASGSASGSVPSSPPRRETVTVDVHLLIQKLTSRATCLGRSPGFRQQDINEAFWKAARIVGS